MFLTSIVILAAADAKSLQSCPTVRPHGLQPTRLLCPWDSPGKNTGVGSHFLLQCMKMKSETEVTQSCLTLCNPMDCSPPGSSWWEYWSGLPFPSPLDLYFCAQAFSSGGEWGLCSGCGTLAFHRSGVSSCGDTTRCSLWAGSY